jgi:hypothetical protein
MFTLGSTAQATLVPHDLKKKKTPSEGMMDVVSTWIKIMMDFSLSSFIR